MGDTLAALRALMASHSPPLDALVVPSEDYHQVRSRSCFFSSVVLLNQFYMLLDFSISNFLFQF